jgi:tetratricopeptide (TPR) repeat protein
MIKKFILLFAAAACLCLGQVKNDANNRFMLAQSYMQAGQLEKAQSILTELYNSNPANPQFFETLNEVLIRLKDYDTSVKLIEKRISASPQDINLYGLLGSTYILSGKEQTGFDVWDDALNKLPGSVMNYRVIANYAIERRSFDKAIDLLKKGKDVSDDKDMFSFDLANLYSITMGFKEAAEEYCEILSRNPNQVHTIEGRILSYISRPGALDETIKVFEDCKKEDDPNFIYLIAGLYRENKNYEKAYEYYLQLDKFNGSQGAELFNFAQNCFNEGEYQAAYKAYNDVIRKYPESPFAPASKLGYAKTTEYLILTEDAAAVPVWKPFYTPKPLGSGKVEEVIEAYKDIAKLYYGTGTAGEALVRIGKLLYHYENKQAEAKEAFLEVIGKYAMSGFAGEACEELAEILLKEGKTEESEKYLQMVNRINADPERKSSSRYKLAKIHFFKGEFEQSKEILDDLTGNLKDNTANDAIELSLILNTTMNDSSNLLILAEGELLAEQDKFEEAKAKYQQLVENPRGFMISHLAKIRVAEMELARDNYETSTILLSKIADEKEKNIYADKALYLLGQIYQFGMNNAAKAVEVYESLLANFPNSLYLDEAREAILKLRNKVS